MKEFLEKLKEYNYKKMVLIILFILIYLAGFAYLFYLYMNLEKNESNSELSINNIIEIIPTKEDISIAPKIYVDIKGSINKPGVYELEKGSRVIDLVNMAGGLKKDANTRFINLSKILKDGEAIVIYSNSEIEKANKKETIYVEVPCVCEEVKNDACIKENTTNSDDNINLDNNSELNNLININKASKEEFMKLNGIGEAKANAIIKYRNENGDFKSIEDIIKVDGISETIFSKIKNNITI